MDGMRLEIEFELKSYCADGKKKFTVEDLNIQSPDGIIMIS
jgi:hypothetical protein